MDKTVYNQTGEYAIEHDELDKYRKSRAADKSCKAAIIGLAAENHRDGHFDSDVVIHEAVSEYGLERVKFVLANTVRRLECDGRFSIANKEWAKTIPSPAGERHSDDILLDRIHSCLLNDLVDEVKKIIK